MHGDQICHPDDSKTGKEACARVCGLAQVGPTLRQIERHEIRQNELGVQIRRQEEEDKQIANVNALAAPQVRRTLTVND